MAQPVTPAKQEGLSSPRASVSPRLRVESTYFYLPGTPIQVREPKSV